MRFTWKGPSTISAYPSNTAPDLYAPGPYPSKESQPPKTVTKTVLKTIPRPSGVGTAYYDPLQKTVLFTSEECTTIGTSLPTVCMKRLSRPLKIWRKRLNADGSSSKVTLNQIQGTSVIVSKDATHCVHTDVYPIDTTCQKIKIRRSGGFNPSYCSTTREYLQKRCKTYDQNQLQGKKLEDYTFKSGEGSEPLPVMIDDIPIDTVTGICNKITIKPSNRAFQEQGGVTASSRTNRLKYDTVMSNVPLKNYATARATIDGGYVNIKGQNKPVTGFIYARQDRPRTKYCEV
jgi:hypothetical protein